MANRLGLCLITTKLIFYQFPVINQFISLNTYEDKRIFILNLVIFLSHILEQYEKRNDLCQAFNSGATIEYAVIARQYLSYIRRLAVIFRDQSRKTNFNHLKCYIVFLKNLKLLHCFSEYFPLRYMYNLHAFESIIEALCHSD